MIMPSSRRPIIIKYGKLSYLLTAIVLSSLPIIYKERNPHRLVSIICRLQLDVCLRAIASTTGAISVQAVTLALLSVIS